MTPGEFIAKWRASELKERSAAQEHFIDLCRLLGEPTPAEADPAGETYCFERGARKDGGGEGWTDVWKRHCFAWEYKGKHANLDAAFAQLRQYALALENPPLLVVSDMARFRIRTHWTNTVSETHEFGLDDLANAAVRTKLKWALSDPERLRRGASPRRSRSWPATCSGRWPRGGGSDSSRWRGSTAGCSTMTRPRHSRRRRSRPRWRPPPSTGRRSTPRSSAPCSSAGSTRTSARSSVPTTPTGTRSGSSSSPR